MTTHYGGYDREPIDRPAHAEYCDDDNCPCQDTDDYAVVPIVDGFAIVDTVERSTVTPILCEGQWQATYVAGLLNAERRKAADRLRSNLVRYGTH